MLESLEIKAPVKPDRLRQLWSVIIQETMGVINSPTVKNRIEGMG